MTCIKFFIGFSGRNTTIRDLYSRMHYLTTAQRHFQSALDAKQRAREHRPSAGGRGRSHHRSSDDYQPMAASTKSMSVADLHSHISTITLQMKVYTYYIPVYRVSVCGSVCESEGIEVLSILPHFLCALPHFLCALRHFLCVLPLPVCPASLPVCPATSCVPCQVTEFLYQCAEATGTLRTPLTTSGEVGGANSSGGGARKPPQPITLFSSGHTRAEVAVQLMLSSQDIVEGFEIAQGIMQVHVHAQCSPYEIQCTCAYMYMYRHV